MAYRVISDQGAAGGVIHFTLLHPATDAGPAPPRPRVTLPPTDTAAGSTDPTTGGLPWWIRVTLAAVTTATAAMIIRDMRTDPTVGRTAAQGSADPGPVAADDGSPTR